MLKKITPLVLFASCGAWAQNSNFKGDVNEFEIIQNPGLITLSANNLLRPKANVPNGVQGAAVQRPQPIQPTPSNRPAQPLATSQSYMSGEAQKKPDEQDVQDMVPFNPEDLQNPQDWKRKYFEVVIVINKANRGAKKQSLDLYQNGNLIYSIPVSTGREQYEEGSEDPTDKHSPTKGYFTSTPTGYYTPYFLNIDHVSKQWKDAFMPYAVFFNGGIAVHQAPAGTEPRLGTRASGGCIRVPSRVAADIFWRVRNSGGPYLAEEKNKDIFVSQAWYYQPHYQTAYTETPTIPRISRRGEIDLKNMRKGFRTLIIVENREVDGVSGAIPLPTQNPIRLRMNLENRYQSGQYVAPEEWQRLQEIESGKALKSRSSPPGGAAAIQAPAEIQPVYTPKVEQTEITRSQTPIRNKPVAN